MSGVKMVDITAKESVYREASSYGRIKLKPSTIKLLKEGKVEKGDVITAAKLAGVMAAKSTASLIPLCHPIPITGVDVDVSINDDAGTVEVVCTVRTNAKTGVEMEALVCVMTSLLTIWDMVKKYEKDEKGQYPHTAITDVRVIMKRKQAGYE